MEVEVASSGDLLALRTAARDEPTPVPRPEVYIHLAPREHALDALSCLHLCRLRDVCRLHTPKIGCTTSGERFECIPLSLTRRMA